MSERTGTMNLETRNDMQSGNHFYIIICNLKKGDVWYNEFGNEKWYTKLESRLHNIVLCERGQEAGTTNLETWNDMQHGNHFYKKNVYEILLTDTCCFGMISCGSCLLSYTFFL